MSLEERVAALEARTRQLEDHIEILNLLAGYGPAVDSGQSAAAARLWDADGVYDVGGVARVQGHAELTALYEAELHQGLIRQGRRTSRPRPGSSSTATPRLPSPTPWSCGGPAIPMTYGGPRPTTGTSAGRPPGGASPNATTARWTAPPSPMRSSPAPCAERPPD